MQTVYKNHKFVCRLRRGVHGHRDRRSTTSDQRCMYSRKRVGTRTDPCGTPHMTGAAEDTDADWQVMSETAAAPIHWRRKKSPVNREECRSPACRRPPTGPTTPVRADKLKVSVAGNMSDRTFRLTQPSLSTGQPCTQTEIVEACQMCWDVVVPPQAAPVVCTRHTNWKHFRAATRNHRWQPIFGSQKEAGDLNLNHPLPSGCESWQSQQHQHLHPQTSCPQDSRTHPLFLPSNPHQYPHYIEFISLSVGHKHKVRLHSGMISTCLYGGKTTVQILLRSPSTAGML